MDMEEMLKMALEGVDRKLINDFTTEEFKDFCRAGDVIDLQWMLRRFERLEFYEHCVLIYDVIKEKNTSFSLEK